MGVEVEENRKECLLMDLRQEQLLENTATGGRSSERKRAHCDDLQLVYGLAKVQCRDVSRPMVGTHAGASGQAGLVPVWLMDMMECLILWQFWDLWARARHRRPFPGWIKNHSQRRTSDWCGLRFQGMFQTAADTPIPYVHCDKESKVDEWVSVDLSLVFQCGSAPKPESEEPDITCFFGDNWKCHNTNVSNAFPL